jgi:hypothetical protein
MLKSYQAIYQNGQIKWLEDRPKIESAQIIVTILNEMYQNIKKLN